MTENMFLLQDRIQKIQQIVGEYGEDNFYISFSGGKDSTVLSALVDMALPGNKIPRVNVNTGIELNMVHDFVVELQKEDDRYIIIPPKVSIQKTLMDEGYPFKSKAHSKWVDQYQRNGRTQSTENYTGSPKRDRDLQRTCPKVLLYQFEKSFDMRISDKCCKRLKEDPLWAWSKENGRPYSMIGLMREEGGRRMNAQCLAFIKGKLRSFQPLAPMTKDWEEWFIAEYDIKICDIYKEPYNFERTGCKGCPFNPHIQDELDTLQKFFPAERKQCELIWAPVYKEYRRINYRLDQSHDQMTIDEWLEAGDGNTG